MKRFVLCILALIITSCVLCLSSCKKGNDVSSSSEENSLSSDVDQSSELSQNDPEKNYIVLDEIDVVFDIENSTMTITDTQREPLVQTIVFEDEVIKVTSVFEDEKDEVLKSEYQYSKNGGKITEFSSKTANARIEYDEKDRISKITLVASENTFVYSFSYSESGIMAITSDSKADTTLYGHKDFLGIISSEVIDSVVVENNELLIKADGSEKTYAVDEVSAEEFELFSKWNLIDFTLELYTTFDRGFVLE